MICGELPEIMWYHKPKANMQSRFLEMTKYRPSGCSQTVLVAMLVIDNPLTWDPNGRIIGVQYKPKNCTTLPNWLLNLHCWGYADLVQSAQSQRSQCWTYLGFICLRPWRIKSTGVRHGFDPLLQTPDRMDECGGS